MRRAISQWTGCDCLLCHNNKYLCLLMRTAMSQLPSNCDCTQGLCYVNNKLIVVAYKDSCVTITNLWLPVRTAWSQWLSDCDCTQRQLCRSNKIVVIAHKDSLVTVMKWLWLHTRVDSYIKITNWLWLPIRAVWSQWWSNCDCTQR